MAKRVKCKYCGQEFDRDITAFVKLSTRYAHASCHEKAEKEAAELRKVTDLIQSLYYPTNPNWGLLGKQIQKYRDEGMTYLGMYYTLTYFFIIQKHSIKESKGIGIIPYVYRKAEAYYKNMDNTYTKTAEIEQRDKLDIKQTEDIVTIIHSKPKKKLISFDYEE